MGWYSLWRYCMILFAVYHDLLGNCTAINITTTEAVPAISNLPGYLGKSCPVRCLQGKCTFLDDGGIDCTDGCNDGYMGKMCNFPCRHKCSKCERENADDCIKCDQGYFGELCDKCPNACGEQGCYGNGICKKDCLAINICGNKCLPGCKICNDTFGKCQKCANNFMGENCETSCSDNCRSICSTQNCPSQCDRDTGRCLHGCEPGSWGERCADQCSPRCLDQNCNETSGQCVQCIRGYHGSQCHLPCVNCKDSGCLKTTGTCKKCDAGFYGHTCTQTCLNCSSDVCDRLSGLCSNVSMTNIIDDSSTISSAVPRYLPAISSITLVIAVFSAVAFIVIIILVYRLRKLTSRLIMYGSGHRPSPQGAVHGSHEYDEINLEEMDPSSGDINNDEPYYSPLVHGELEAMTLAEDQMSRQSSEDASLIIPYWFGFHGDDKSLTPKHGTRENYEYICAINDT